MEILLYFVAYLIIAMLFAVLFKLCNMDEDSATFLAVIWPISVPASIVTAIITTLVIVPIEFILKRIK